MRNWALSGVWCKRHLRLQAALDEWCNVVGLVGRRWWKSDEDVPWWYNERANLSLFASAVSKSGGVAFEEFSAEKRSIGRTTGRFHKRYMGRVDLYFETASGAAYTAEAKCVWSGATSAGSDAAARVRDRLESAKIDIRKFPPDGARRIGMVFARPYLRYSRRGDPDKQIEAWLDKLWEIDCDAMAWSFPNNMKLGKGYDTHCPGVVVLIKEVRR